jgi:hypothetical protein
MLASVGPPEPDVAPEEGSVPSLEDRGEIIAAVAEQTGVDPDLIVSLLALEPNHRNLHAWGARPSLRRDIDRLIEVALKKVPDAGS